MRSYLRWRAGCLYRQTAGSWNVLDTLSDVIICNHLSATRRFCHVPEPSVGFQEVPQDSKRFHGIPWGSMRFYDVSVNRSVPTEANRGLTSYMYILLRSTFHIIRDTTNLHTERKQIRSHMLLRMLISEVNQHRDGGQSPTWHCSNQAATHRTQTSSST
jgi:hypothetical protein